MARRLAPIAFAIFSASTLFGLVSCISKGELFPFETDQDQQLQAGDDVASPEITLRVPIAFYENVYNSIFVNDNGLLSFATEMPSFFNAQFPLTYPIIAPLYADVDIRANGRIYYRETNDAQLLERATSSVTSNFPDSSEYVAKSLFIATWLDVGHYNQKDSPQNTFQVVIASDGVQSYALFLYPEDGIKWIQGDGKVQNLPDARAQAGFMSGDGRLYALRGSGSEQVRNYPKMSNTVVREPGVWIFRLGSAGPTGNVQPATEGRRASSEPETCASSDDPCPPSAECVANDRGICCVCSTGFVGNGRNCLPNDAAQRLNGKVNGRINDVQLDNIDLHAYISPGEGRTYTALSRLPAGLDQDAQSLLIISDVIGWQFADSKSGLPNGFTLTGGVFNRSVEIVFPQTSHRVSLTEQYLGLDVFNNLRARVEIRGSIPPLLSGSKIEVADFAEEYTPIARGQLRSHVSRSFHLEGNALEIPFTVDQTIVYTECPFQDKETSAFRVDVSKNYIVYDDRDKIVRFAASYKTSPLSADDPCRKTSCGEFATCITENDAPRCMCVQGYEMSYFQEAGEDKARCVDIDECSARRHRCHINAECLNTQGSYSCRCRQGFTGDGTYCQQELTCDELQCDTNGECIENRNRMPECRCKRGYRGNGYYCQQVDEDSDAVAVDCRQPGVTCDVNAECAPNQYTQTYDCVCKSGYIGPGSYCVQNPDYCQYQCDDNSECVFNQTLREWTCVLKETRSQDECTGNEQCTQNAQCLFNSAEQRRKCECNPGYLLSTPSEGTVLCLPDEAAPCNVVANCHAQATCAFDVARRRYACKCANGFTGDGKQCERSVISCNILNNCDVRAKCQYTFNEQGYRCMCNDGYRGDGLTCRPTRPCNEDATQCDASAECTFFPELQGYSCVCSAGFVGDGLECRPAPRHGGDYLIFAQGMSLLRMSLQPEESRNGRLLLTKPNQIPVGLDVDCLNGHVYWTDVSRKAIHRMTYNGSWSETAFQGVTESPEGIAVDWVSRNIYWTDSLKDVIQVAPLHGAHAKPKTLIRDGLVDPRGIVVHPGSGRMYWTDWNRYDPKIETSLMDGTNRETFVAKQLGLPNMLTIDYVTNDLCWTDAEMKRIECIALNGDRRRVVFPSARYPFDLTVAGDYIFWTDWETKNVQRVSRHGGEVTLLDLPLGGNGKVYGITTIPDHCPRVSNACVTNNGGCKHICLPTGRSSRSCACPDGPNGEENECQDDG